MPTAPKMKAPPTATGVNTNAAQGNIVGVNGATPVGESPDLT